MTSRARWMVAVAAVLMCTAYVLPLWRVDLIAPQYPEGLGMFIEIDGVRGLKPQDLNSINNLNHYIGMKAIVPEAIPELKYMPWILGVLIAGGLAVAAWGRRVPLYVWGGVLALTLTAGLYDYWRWGYDYGHDLDEEVAIIKVEGMTYQPPLIGSKKLLNFRATSWPSGGGIAISLAAVLVALAILDSRKRRGLAAALLLGAVASGCAPAGPRPIALGQDQCHYCKMEITDARYGAQVVMRTGRVQVFDSVECLAAFVGSAPAESIASVWVADVAAPATFVRAEQAGYLLDGVLRGPMGRAVSFATPAAAAAEGARTGGVTVSWRALVADSAAVLSHGGH